MRFYKFTYVAGDCFTLGRHAYNQNDMYHTVNWMSEALKVEEEERNKTADRADILDYLAYSTALVRVLSSGLANLSLLQLVLNSLVLESCSSSLVLFSFFYF